MSDTYDTVNHLLFTAFYFAIPFSSIDLWQTNFSSYIICKLHITDTDIGGVLYSHNQHPHENRKNKMLKNK